MITDGGTWEEEEWQGMRSSTLPPEENVQEKGRDLAPTEDLVSQRTDISEP